MAKKAAKKVIVKDKDVPEKKAKNVKGGPIYIKHDGVDGSVRMKGPN